MNSTPAEMNCPACGDPIIEGAESCQTCSNAIRERVLPKFSEAFLEDFDILEILGRGGMGTVVKARQKKLDRFVCIKLLKLAETSMQDRFMEEGRLLAQIKHPRIIAIHDFRIDQNVPFLVTEYVEGQNLRELMKTQDRLTIDFSLRLALEILEGLQAAHEHHVIHRDIKPDNVLLDQKMHAKLADFGLARSTRLDFRRTSSGMLVGTPSYMSPEQVGSAPTGPATDIYSTGVLLFEMLTGDLPFTGKTPFEILNHHVNTPAPRASTFRPELPRSLDGVLHRALAKDPDHRFQSAEQFHKSLELIRKAVNASKKYDTITVSEIPELKPPP